MTTTTVCFICSIIFINNFISYFLFICFCFTFLCLLCWPQDTFYNLGTMFNNVSLQPALDWSISLQYTIQKLFQNEYRNNLKVVLIFLKKIFNAKFLLYPSILLVVIGSQIASIHWCFTKRFSELNYHFPRQSPKVRFWTISGCFYTR